MNSERPDYGTEARREALENGSGFSTDSARIHLGEKVVSGSAELPAFAKLAHGPRASGRGGRSYEEISGRDVSRMLANQDALDNPRSDTQDETNRKGAALARATLAKVKKGSQS